MIKYLKGILLAVLNKPFIMFTPFEVEKKVTVVRDLSMTTADMEDVRKAFPLQRWKEGCTLNDFARSEGEQRVIEFFEKRIKARTQTIHTNNIL